MEERRKWSKWKKKISKISFTHNLYTSATFSSIAIKMSGNKEKCFHQIGNL